MAHTGNPSTLEAEVGVLQEARLDNLVKLCLKILKIKGIGDIVPHFLDSIPSTSRGGDLA